MPTIPTAEKKPLKARIEEHPIGFAVVLVVTTAILTGSTIVWVQRERFDNLRSSLQSQIDELKTRISSIERGFGGDNLIDARKFFLDKDRRASLSKMAHYYPEGKFYARQEPEKWKYSKMHETKLVARILGEKNPIVQRIDPNQLTADKPLHVWRANTEEWVLDDPTPIKRAFPYIVVQRIPIEKLESLAKGQVFSGDLFSFLLTWYIKQARQIALTSERLHYIIRNVEKKKQQKVLYMQVLYTLDNPVIQGEPKGNLYLTQEVYTVLSGHYVYQLQIGIPSWEPIPRGEYFAWVNEWLSDFGIVPD